VFEIVGGITPQGGVRVELRDSGEGIASENISRIFTPGFTTRPGSPGLGLAVCKTIIEQHRGTIDVQSKAGQGTTFTLEFPLAGDNP
jgi:two-component system NtrC family sensor kinase